MSIKGKWKSISFERKVLLVKVPFVLMSIFVGLRILSFSNFRNLFTRLVESKHIRSYTESTVHDVCWATRVIAARMPFSILCLPQALTAKFFLRNDPTIRVPIGVLLQAGGTLEAHAWVEWKGKVVLGELPDKQFQPIWEWE